MVVVSITRLLDEADIIESFVRHNAMHIDHFIFMDNGSKDGTIEILEQLRLEGISIIIFQNKSVSFREAPFNTKMFMDAVRIYGAEWIFCLDADEFIDDSRVAGGLDAALRRCSEMETRHLALRIPLYEYRRSIGDDAGEINVVLRQRRHLPPFGVSKVFLSGTLASMGATVGGGNHDAFVDGQAVASFTEPGLRLAHFAERSHQQVVAKWIKGWAKVLATGIAATSSGASLHYRVPFEIIRDRPEDLLRNKSFIENDDERLFIDDPITYKGTALRYTKDADDAMRAIRMVVGYLEELATRYGYLVEQVPAAAAAIDALDANFNVILGNERVGSGVQISPSSHPDRSGDRPKISALLNSIVRWRASKALKKQDFAKADELLENRLRRMPADPALMKLYAFSAHNSGRFSEAVVRWSNARRTAPSDAMCHAGIAANLREIGAIDFASSVIDAALFLFPADPTILTEAARIAVEQHRFSAALDLTDRAILVAGPSKTLIDERNRLVIKVEEQMFPPPL